MREKERVEREGGRRSSSWRSKMRRNSIGGYRRYGLTLSSCVLIDHDLAEMR
jgi:hypothetical protein